MPAFLRRVSGEGVLCLRSGTAQSARANSVMVTRNGYTGNDSDGLSLTGGILGRRMLLHLFSSLTQTSELRAWKECL